MGVDTNPEMGSTTPQPIPGLNERSDNRGPAFLALNPTEIDTLERAASPTALSELRQWTNSQLPVNRTPHEILIIIATYVVAADPSGYETLICLTHVCTRWRRVITTYPTFWTHVSFGGKNMTSSLANIFFQRAKGCNMDVDVSFQPARPKRGRWRLSPPKNLIPVISPGQRIRTLAVWSQSWSRIQALIRGWADALSPLERLIVSTDHDEQSLTPPTIFVGEALKSLKVTGLALLGLYHFRAPNLTVLDLMDTSQTLCSVETLFDFLDASPSLEEVCIGASLSIAFSPSERRVTLSRVRRINLEMKHVARVASQLICPSVTTTIFAHGLPEDLDVNILPPTIFPPTLHSLLGQYSIESIDKVLMHVADRDGYPCCILQFHAPSGAIFWFFCRPVDQPDETWPFSTLFEQTVSTLLSLPLDQVVTLAIFMQDVPETAGDPHRIRTKLAEVFEKCSNLREVVLENYDPGRCPDFSGEKTPYIRTLIIKHPEDASWEEMIEDVTEVARIRHSKGKPLERVEIFSAVGHPGTERLEALVREVEYSGVHSWRHGRITSWT